MRGPIWTKKDLTMLKRMYPDHTAQEVAEVLGCTKGRVYSKANELGLAKSEAFKASDKSKRIQRGKHTEAMKAKQFKPGQISWNKGVKGVTGVQEACRATQFKKGRPAHEARNYQPIGTERMTRDGYIERKVTDDPTKYPARRWMMLQRIVWEQANGPVPNGHIIRFKNGDKTDCRLENLECVTWAENARRNVANIPPEIRKVNQLRGVLQRQINKRREAHV